MLVHACIGRVDYLYGYLSFLAGKHRLLLSPKGPFVYQENKVTSGIFHEILWKRTGRKTRALQVPPVVPYKALGKFLKALYGTTAGTRSARVFRPVMITSHRKYDARTQPRCEGWV